MGFRWVFILLLLLPYVAAQPACQIQTHTGYLPDADCDGVDDSYDNCPQTQNSMQQDTNNNGVGDACDYITTIVDFSPSTIVMPGDIVTLQLQTANSRLVEIEKLQVRIVSEQLNINLQTQLESLPAGSYHTFDFLLKIPACIVKGQKKLTITLDYQDGETILHQTLFETLNVKESDCNREETALDNTRLDTIIFQEVLAGQSVIYPLTLTNVNNDAQTYKLTVENIEHIGSYSLDPSAELTIPSLQSKTLYLHITTKDSAPAGNNKITLVIETPTSQDKTDVGLRILQEVKQTSTTAVVKTALEISLIILVLVLIIGGIILTLKKANEGSK